MARTPYPSKERNMTIKDTAKSLLHFFGTCAEWGSYTGIDEHVPSDALRELCDAVVALVPAAWKPSSATTGGSVRLNIPNPATEQGAVAASVGVYYRHMTVYSIEKPAGWTEADAATAERMAVDQAVCAVLVGIAGGLRPGCAQAMATLTDEDIAKAEQDDLGGEGG